MRRFLTLALLFFPVIAFASVRDNFLRSGPDARIMSLGDTGVVSALGSEAIFWNPARMMASAGHDVLLQYSRPQLFTNRGWVMTRYGGRSVKLGLGGKWESFSAIDGFASKVSQAYFLSMAMPFPILKAKYPISIGTSLGVVSVGAGDTSANSMFVNLGFSGQIHRDVNVGLAFDNIYFSGLTFSPGTAKERFPLLTRFGFSFKPSRILRGALMGFAEGTMSSDGFQGGMGVQFSPMPLFALRLGMSGMPRFGLGVQPLGKAFSFDLGYRMGGRTSDQVGASFVYRWGLPQKQKDVDDPWALAKAAHKSLTENMRIRFRESTQVGVEYLDVMHVARFLALSPTDSEVWTLMERKLGGENTPARCVDGIPKNKTEGLPYLNFAHAYARDQNMEARSRGEEYMRQYPGTELSRLVGFLLRLMGQR